MLLRTQVQHIRKRVATQLYHRSHGTKLGISAHDYIRLNKFDRLHRGEFFCLFSGKPITFSSPFWFLHSLKEIYIDETYKFDLATTRSLIIDCGANVGLSAIYLKRAHPSARIIAFEPDPGVFNQLQANLSPYRFEDVELVNAAVWNKITEINFSSEGSVGGQIQQGSKAYGTTIGVPTIRLRDYLNQKVDFLKIDIEGVEYDVLLDCKDLLHNVEKLFVEYHVLPDQQQHLHIMLGWFQEAGFKYYIREAWDNMTHPLLGQLNDHYQMQLNIFCYR